MLKFNEAKIGHSEYKYKCISWVTGGYWLPYYKLSLSSAQDEADMILKILTCSLK